MPIVPQSDSPSRTKSIPRFPKDELTGPLALLSPEARCLVNDLRDWAAANDGIEPTEDAVLLIARRLGFSRAKFFKLWAVTHRFFAILDAKPDAQTLRLTYVGDQNCSTESSELVLPQRVKSEQHQAAARTRWMRTHATTHSGTHAEMDATHGKTHEFSPTPPSEASEAFSSSPEDSLKEGPAAASEASSRGEAAAAGPPPGLQNLSRAVSDEDYQAIAMRSIELGMQAPDRVTAVRILQRFPKIPTHKFPLFKGQKSPGLWLYKHPIDMELEIARQETQRKPTAMEWAIELDKRRANQL